MQMRSQAAKESELAAASQLAVVAFRNACVCQVAAAAAAARCLRAERFCLFASATSFA